MDNKILYSFVLPAFKAHYFREAINSILAQTYTNFELIIVNDASPEDLDTIVHSFNDSRIRYYVNKENLGGKDLVAQWNYCISYALGDYLILASDDDVYDHQYLEKMNSLVKKYPDVNVFRPRVQYINGIGEIERIGGILNEYASSMEYLYYQTHIGKGIPFYVFKKQALNDMGGFIKYPLAWHSDDMTILQMTNRGIVFCSDILFSMRISGESISSKLNNAEILKQKVIATNQYYSDLFKILRETNLDSNIDEFFHSNLIKTIKTSHITNLSSWFISSTKKAVLLCFPLYWSIKLFKKKQLIKMYIRKILS